MPQKARPTHRSNDSALSNSMNGRGRAHLLGDPKDLEKGGTDWQAARSQLPPLWVDVVDRVDEAIRNIQGQMKELSRLHRKRLLVSFDEKAEAGKEQEILALTEAITEQFRVVERKLTAVGGQMEGESDAEVKVRRNLQRSMASKTQRLSHAFRFQQKDYLKKLRAQKEGAMGGGEFAFLDKDEGGEPVLVPDNRSETGFRQAQVTVLESAEALVQERDSEIARIAEGIEALAHVMKRLGELVIDQGSVLDRIDYNIDMAVDRVQQGVTQLEATEKIQKQGGATSCILTLIFLIFALLVVQVIKHAPRKR
ncbi:qa- syp4 tlg2p syntaxin 16-type [Nannochloropsis gaditana]|uniref:Qa-syp4 tlg2p syntaxin 16-type n=1 Tax=Nannochloropsis gaditana TaxID=72520 RepID=W7TPG1_9STRA|nr:qa- syp4 tlg2p syntaxin 16-type [Nannochloropsis gaditana]